MKATKRGNTLPKLTACLGRLTTCSVIFSFWKTTLDLIPPVLEAAGIRYARLDGRLTKSQRSKSLHDFRTDLNLKVLLATISVAGFG
jgi:SWI/SNF-related matrix-associated actin-dependent regulator of chromatin subfamily A3